MDPQGGGNYGVTFEALRQEKGEKNKSTSGRRKAVTGALTDEQKKLRVVLKRVGERVGSTSVRADFLSSGTLAKGVAETGVVEIYMNRKIARMPQASGIAAKFKGEFVVSDIDGPFTRGSQWLVWDFESDATYVVNRGELHTRVCADTLMCAPSWHSISTIITRSRIREESVTAGVSYARRLSDALQGNLGPFPGSVAELVLRRIPNDWDDEKIAHETIKSIISQVRPSIHPSTLPTPQAQSAQSAQSAHPSRGLGSAPTPNPAPSVGPSSPVPTTHKITLILYYLYNIHTYSYII